MTFSVPDVCYYLLWKIRTTGIIW